MRYSHVLAAFTAVAVIAAPAVSSVFKPDPAIAKAVDFPGRTEANKARDKFRHPAETLGFFGVKPGQTIVEIWPGNGWYTEILAPFTKSGNGTLYAAAATSVDKLKPVSARMESDAANFGHVKLAVFPSVEGQPKVPDGVADAVLTFRNVHNWRMGGFEAKAFAEMFAMLKPGGTLGIVDHRLPESADEAREKTSGYMKVSTIKRLAKEAGFEFVAESEVNANPKDTTDWPKGVWTLPPVMQMKDVDKDKYIAIGESDRMTLKFRKPR